MEPSLGEVGYEAYRKHSDGRSLVSGQEIPSWASLPQAIQDAWAAAGDAIAAHVGRADAGSATLKYGGRGTPAPIAAEDDH